MYVRERVCVNARETEGQEEKEGVYVCDGV